MKLIYAHFDGMVNDQIVSNEILSAHKTVLFNPK